MKSIIIGIFESKQNLISNTDEEKNDMFSTLSTPVDIKNNDENLYIYVYDLAKKIENIMLNDIEKKILMKYYLASAITEENNKRS